jgi:hypothetical protein
LSAQVVQVSVEQAQLVTMVLVELAGVVILNVLALFMGVGVLAEVMPVNLRQFRAEQVDLIQDAVVEMVELGGRPI